MSIIATQPEKQERELLKAGTHPAYLYRVIYLGTQRKTYDGKESQSQKVWVDFELPKEVVEYEDKETKEKKTFIRSAGAEFTLSLSEKGKLLPIIQGWLGRSLTSDELKSFDISSFLGKPAFITITHQTGKNGKTYANITAVAPVMDGYTMPSPVNTPVEIGKEQWHGKLFASLPEFLRKKIEESNEWRMIEFAEKAIASSGTSSYIPVVEVRVKGEDGEEIPF